MKIKYLVIGKKSFVKDGKTIYILKLLVQQCDAMPVIAGSIVSKFVDKTTYDLMNVDCLKSVEHEVLLELADNSSYADLHLNITFIN